MSKLIPHSFKLQSFLRYYHIELLLFCVVLISYSYFYNGALGNQNSRLDAIFAFVEPGTSDYLTFRINRFLPDPLGGNNTNDWARVGDDYYSNKAPGPALIGIPFYFLLFHGESLIGMNPRGIPTALINAYLIHVFVTIIPIACSICFFFRLILPLVGFNRNRALLNTVTLYWGTLLFPFSSQLWGHSTAAAFVIISTYFYMSFRRLSHFYCGLFGGIAVLCEYSCAILILLLLAKHLWDRKFKDLIEYTFGGLIPFSAFVTYHSICFGFLFVLPARFNNPQFVGTNGIGGAFGKINWDALWGITFSPYRGLFVYMPVLLLIFLTIQRKKYKQYQELYTLSILCIAGFLFMNITFNGWHGGASNGPRYQIPVIPLYVILLAKLKLNLPYKFLYLGLLMISCFNMLCIAMIHPIVPQIVPNPLWKYYICMKLMAFDGEDLLHPWDTTIRLFELSDPVVKKLSSFNWGELLGFVGISSIIPWICFMTGSLGFICHRTRIVSASEISRSDRQNMPYNAMGHK